MIIMIILIVSILYKTHKHTQICQLTVRKVENWTDKTFIRVHFGHITWNFVYQLSLYMCVNVCSWYSIMIIMIRFILEIYYYIRFQEKWISQNIEWVFHWKHKHSVQKKNLVLHVGVWGHWSHSSHWWKWSDDIPYRKTFIRWEISAVNSLTLWISLQIMVIITHSSSAAFRLFESIILYYYILLSLLLLWQNELFEFEKLV